MIEVGLTRGQIALIDDVDANQVVPFSWFAIPRPKSRTFYAARQQTMDGVSRIIPMHRWILGIEDPSVEIDHWNHVGTDNRRENMRICSHPQNVCNRRGWSGGPKGVRKHGKGWEARIRADGKEIYLGNHKTEIEAAKAYNLAAETYFGEFALLNLIEGEI
jgi:hypothetical protein